MTPEADPRVVVLEGGCNFRDIGGYGTADGRSVRRGRVFRSGVLDRLNDNDRVTVAALGLRGVIDLRTTLERAARPSALPEACLSGLWSRDYEMSGGDHEAPRAQPRTLDEQRVAMRKIYRAMPFEQAEAYRVLFGRLAAAETPLLFHCAGGKDRTGVAAALLLDLLGVPRAVIEADYVMTEACFARDLAVLEGVERTVEQRAAIAPLLRADPAYLVQMFDNIGSYYGSTAAYLRDGLGLDAGAVDSIREHLLEPGAPHD